MLKVLDSLRDSYTRILDAGDPRVGDWPLMQSPWPTLTLVFCYVYFVKVVGPAWMKDRKPFYLRKLMVVYNFTMVVVNAWLFIQLGRLGWFNEYNWRCQPVDYSDNPEALQMASIGWWYFATRFVEFADTNGSYRIVKFPPDIYVELLGYVFEFFTDISKSKTSVVGHLQLQSRINFSTKDQEGLTMILFIKHNPITLYEWMMSKSDPRTNGWPLLGSPFPMLTIIASYVYFVKVLGPVWMKNRKPFQIENIIIAYNVVQVILSGFFFFYGGSLTYLSGNYNWLCQPINYATDPEAITLVKLGWWYLLLKIAEFLDTIFFVLRKKFTHISALHVLHHSLVAWGIWIGMKFGAGGHNAFFPFINCFVHMIMYSYYCLAALGPRVKPYLWWKKYITIIQMVQFVLIGLHAVLPLFLDCDFHPGFVYAILGHAVLFLILFLNFYVHSYVKKNEKDHVCGVGQDSKSFNKHINNGSNHFNNGTLLNGIISKSGNVHNRKSEKND
ncbi:elongation of very long chain fatty acids protein AAEL008004-like [Limulus polyphemus]|uniref:Elongation of very long chain fatty acids protein n=1 Tax=Limulus polyphemus TaxID=6850 RepID=A0ABM1BLT1_LIMPO|nr:elongation of very long chain fatty acids protein AAEL008004-like [Limulus polyphemus]